MSFNKNACKRLSIISGVSRENKDITSIINEIVYTFLDKIIYNLIQIINYCGRRTISVNDVKFLFKMTKGYHVICSENFHKLVTMCSRKKELISVLKKEYFGCVYTLRTPFNKLINDICKSYCEDPPHIGKNVAILLQTITEDFIIRIMNRATNFMYNRDTLLTRDIETAIKLTPF